MPLRIDTVTALSAACSDFGARNPPDTSRASVLEDAPSKDIENHRVLHVMLHQKFAGLGYT